MKDLSSHIYRIHKIRASEYKSLYPNSKIKADYLIKIYSERVKGNKNPAYQHGGKFSPFSEKFVKGTENIEKVKAKAVHSRKILNKETTKIEYWLEKTEGNLEEATKLLKQRQTTFSLEKCIEKFGEEAGKQRWLDRQEKWHKNYKKSNFSKISQELFWSISSNLDDLDNIYFAQLDKNKEKDLSGQNNEIRLKLEKVILPDFIDVSQKKIIEVGYGNKKRAEERDAILFKNGYSILHINESEYKKDKTETIEKCLNFLKKDNENCINRYNRTPPPRLCFCMRTRGVIFWLNNKMLDLSENLDRKFVDSIELDLDEWEIESDSGWVPFTHIHKTIEYQEWILETENGDVLICADTHIVFDENLNQIFVKDLIHEKSLIMTKSGPQKVKKLEKTEKFSNMFDITVNSHEHRFYSGNILSHNTTTVAAFILWKILFSDSYTAAVLANKEKQSREILERIKLSYESMPQWLQQGVAVWNKGSIQLENRSKVITAASSGSSIRGQSINFLYCDEFAHIEHSIQQEFYTSTLPTISSGKTTKVVITTTPKGLELFHKLWVDSEEGRNNYKTIAINWYDVPGRDEKWKEETIKNSDERQFAQEFECDFIGSSNTLIEGNVLRRLTYREKINSGDPSHNLSVYEHGIENHSYVMIVDTAEGIGGDYSCFTVIDITELPYKVVCVYRNNQINPYLFPSVILETAIHYNNAMILIETDSVGNQVASILSNDLEYSEIFMTRAKGKNGIILSGGFSNQSRIGIKQTKLTKRIGCATLKTLVETNKIILNDYNIIQELSHFVQKFNGSFHAEGGFHDDLVMTLVLFGWLVSQPSFKNLIDVDLRKSIFEENQKNIEEQLLPLGIYDDGLDEWTDSSIHRMF